MPFPGQVASVLAVFATVAGIVVLYFQIQDLSDTFGSGDGIEIQRIS